MTFSGLRLEVAEGLARLTATTDARNALVAFAEKRKPVFKGR
jgi:hypothetical protein